MTVSSYKPELCKVAMDFLAQGKSMAALSWHLKIARSTLFKWCDDHPEFGEAVELGKAGGQSALEEQGFNSLWANKDFNNVYYLYTMKSQYRVSEVQPVTPPSTNGHNSGKVEEMIKAVTQENPI